MPPFASEKLKQAVKEIEAKLALHKRQGVHRFPVSKGTNAKGEEPFVVAATRAAEKSVAAAQGCFESDEPPPQISEAHERRRYHHRRTRPLEAAAEIFLDCCFLKRALGAEKDPTCVEEFKQPKDEQEGALPVLVVYDRRSGTTFRE